MGDADGEFPADDQQRVLDRLAGLEKVISQDQVQQALQKAGCVNPRKCQLTHEIMLWILLGIGVFTKAPIRVVFKSSRFLRKGEETPSRSALCHARKRLGYEPLRYLFEDVVRPLADKQTPGCFYKEWRLMAFDSTTFNVPDTPANEAAFGRPHGGNGDGAFPQVCKLSLVELGTHAEVAFVANDCHRNERLLVPRLLPHVNSEMLVLLDTGFYGHEMWRRITDCGAQILGRVPSQPVLEPIEALSDGSYLAKLYPNRQLRKQDVGAVVVRVIKYTIDDPQRTGHQQEHRLMTTLLDADAHPAEELIILYHERFEEEHTFDEQKTHQDPVRPSKATHLRSESPAGVIQELYALSLAHFVTRALMVEAAASAGLDPDRISFTGCFHILEIRLPEIGRSANQASLKQWYEAVIWEMSQELTDPRRNRINPRVYKQKSKPKFPKKKPEHRGLPPLTKTFPETVVMLI